MDTFHLLVIPALASLVSCLACDYLFRRDVRKLQREFAVILDRIEQCKRQTARQADQPVTLKLKK